MLKIVLIGVAGLIALALIYAATKPDSFRVERSIVIDAPPADIYPHLEDFHRWMAWSAYELRDPTMKRTFTGPDSGVGSAYAWAGNRKIGSGRMEITESTPNSRLLVRLDFETPMKATNMAEFLLVPEGASTRVTWTMYGPSPYLNKLITLVLSMDTMIGKDFEAGLAALKRTVESTAR